MSESHSDQGTVLQRDQAAITWSKSDGFTFLMPDYPDDAEVPEPVIVLAALITKLDDEEFRRALIEDFKQSN
jgi:hypothetical protein